MVFFILLFAVVNLGLGYGLALYLHGQRPTFQLGKLSRLPSLMKHLPFVNHDVQEIEPPAPAPDAVDSPPPEAPAAQTTPDLDPVNADPLKAVDDDNDASQAFRSLAAATMTASPVAANTPRDDAAPLATSSIKETIATRAAPSPVVDEAAIASAVESLHGEFAAQFNAWRSIHSVTAIHMSVAMIDPDHLKSLNERYGRENIDQALAIIEQSISSELPQEQTLESSNDRTRLYLLPKLPLREAVNFVERHRQQTEATRFKFGNDELQITVSCAVAETSRSESTGALVARLEALLNEAKRYGRNRTFFQEESQPAPAIPPVLQIDGKIVQFDAVGA